MTDMRRYEECLKQSAGFTAEEIALPAVRQVIRELWMRGAQPDDDFVQRAREALKPARST